MMTSLRLIREPSIGGATLGSLYLDGRWQCWTLEDAIRERPGVPVEAWKVAGKTAIPAGRYRVLITDSQRFGRPMPLLDEVPGFAGIRIHAGNTAADTEGCLLVGTERADAQVVNSRAAFTALLPQLWGPSVWIRIENPYVEA